MAKIIYDNKEIEVSDEWSFNATEKSRLEIPNNTVIYATVFSQEHPDTQIFRPNMTGVKFYNCNLDNCVIPEGNEVIGGSQRRFEVQNDGNDWLIDENNNPIKPINHKIFTKLGLTIPSPEDIPITKTSEAIDLLAKAKNINGSLS